MRISLVALQDEHLTDNAVAGLVGQRVKVNQPRQDGVIVAAVRRDDGVEITIDIPDEFREVIS